MRVCLISAVQKLKKVVCISFPAEDQISKATFENQSSFYGIFQVFISCWGGSQVGCCFHINVESKIPLDSRHFCFLDSD